MFDVRKKAPSHIDVDGTVLPICVRRHARAKRMILRMDETTGGVVVTIPKRAAIRDGVHMAQRKSGWIAQQLKKRAKPVMFEDGVELPVLDERLIIRHEPDIRRTHRQGNCVMVSGRAEHLSRRLTDWLKIQAKTELTTRAHEKAERIDHRISRITVRDTRSRWGSCGVNGQLNFSWRLILAPEFVLDYVVAHEVAHLLHHNHGPQFWTLTHSLTARMKEAKTWLNAYGRTLHGYGAKV